MHSHASSDPDNSPRARRGAYLADLLHSIRLRSSVCFQPELRAPWGFSLADVGTTFHIVTQGNCWLEVKGLGNPLRLSAGDFVVMPQGNAQIMCDSPASAIVDFFTLMQRNSADDRGAFYAGGNGAVTKLVCGWLQFENAATDSLLATLPPLIHVKGSHGDGTKWLQATIAHLLEELDHCRAGWQEVFTRLADILFIQAVRTHIKRNPNVECVMASIRDPHIGRALVLLHSRPEESWTVTSLARGAAVSRSLFASKFAQLVGEPPLRYVKRLRINAATIKLRSTDDKLSTIAVSAGYESAAAFTKAFKRYVGKTPGEYRRLEA